MQSKEILTVAELTSAIAELLGDGIGRVVVSGEVSNFKPHSSGHRYFTLKDETAQISCTIWRSRSVNLAITDGMQVEAEGTISVYAPRGQYSLDCVSVRRAGVGSLFARYEKLKAKLEAEGLFDRARKKPLPRLAMRVGVATSGTGAAIRDIFTTLERRFPLAEVYFRPTAVQGAEAQADIVKSISELDALGLDVIIVGRGGGSIEDLWAFNEESVARAIAAAQTPIISAVGHETDFTIADFVADYRAATPTAAAEAASVNTIDSIIDGIDASRTQMTNAIEGRIDEYKQFLERFSGAYSVRRVRDTVMNNARLLDEYETRIGSAVRNRFDREKMRLGHSGEILRSLDPKAPLERGYALLQTGGRYVGNSESVEGMEDLSIVRQMEIAQVDVKNVKKNY